MPAEQADALDLKFIGIYNGRIYVTTKTARLVLDVRTGKEIARDWKVAPTERHDGWVVGYDAAKKRHSIYPGNG